MASLTKRSSVLPSPIALCPFFPSLIIIFFFRFLPCAFAKPLNLSFARFEPNTKGILYQGDANPIASSGEIELTDNRIDKSLKHSVGRAIHDQPLHLWDRKTRQLADFHTHFSFTIKNQTHSGDGLAFFLATNGTVIPPNSSGGFLGLFSNRSIVSSLPAAKTVAVEFDSHKNDWDPSDDHVGINIDDIVSVKSVAWNTSIKNGRMAEAWVSYNSTTHNLSVFLTYDQNPNFCGNSTVHFIVNLMDILPEWVSFGFSAATGDWVELHQIHKWEFFARDIEGAGSKQGKKARLIVGLTVSIGLLVLGGILASFIIRRSRRKDEDDLNMDASMDEEFSKETGPRRFSRKELALATNNFAEEGKLGEGGFGGVYRGFLNELNMNVAVKRVSQGSKQGWKEYAAEVKIISRLRHRNLVQLVGWCHERGEFLLVYEFMPNGSLDTHLFGCRSLLTWPARFKVAQGLAHALLYLQEEWEECVVHRDIKSSNVMLDSGFNSKLGDFGLARLVDHDSGAQTTVLAGTMGYLAPECLISGKASKESDVYSFGIVALEIGCGRRPVETKAEGKKVRLVEWVWDLYGGGKLLEAADSRLNGEFDEKEMERLLVVGLCCAHPGFSLRPSIRHLINVLDCEAPLPSLPAQMPVPVFLSPPMNVQQGERASISLNLETSNSNLFESHQDSPKS